MPFVPLAGELGVVALAAALLALLVAVTYMLQAIGRALGSINLGVVTVPIGKWFTSITAPVVTFLTTFQVRLAQVIDSWLRAIPYLLVGLFNDAKSVLNALFGQIAYLHTSVIPATNRYAQSQATAFTLGHIAALERSITAARTDFEQLAKADSAAEYAKAQALVHTLRAQLVALSATGVSTAERYAYAQDVLIRDEIAAKFKDAKAYADGLLKDLAPPAPGAMGLPGVQGVPGVAGAAGAAAGAIAIPLPGAFDPSLTVQDIRTGAIVGVGTAVAVIASEVENCLVRTCAGNNNLSNLLKDILGFGSLVELGVFLNEVISDPAAAEAKYAGYFESTVQGVVHAGGDVWSELEAVLNI